MAHATWVIAPPLGTNPVDNKHTVHNVARAWDLTRGYGARVGILDSGIALYSDGSRHPDGQGIAPLGFVDDYDNCESTGGQEIGACPPGEDHGHGTSMAGLTGQTDNNIQFVGIMPQGVTYSMKIARNMLKFGSGPCQVNGGGVYGLDFCIEDDDFIAAVDWASSQSFDVLSMSFVGDWGNGVYFALYYAYYTYDILLLASTGNVSADANKEPAKWPMVMGVGGVNLDGSNYGQNANEEVSGLAGIGTSSTLRAYCTQNWGQWCTPNNSGTTGGTSAATVIVAGIAGLTRTQNPTLTAPQVRTRLINLSNGPHHIVDAGRSVWGQ